MAAALVAASIGRVPTGEAGLHGSSLSSPGWEFHPPFSRSIRLSNPGKLVVPAVELKTREGSALAFRLELDYTLGHSLAPALADDIRRVGLDGAVGLLARRILEGAALTADTDTLLSSPAATEAPLRAALQAAGLGVTRLSFATKLGDEVVRRTRTEEALRLARPASAPVVVVGWDGADWQTALPLMAAGRMPNLARLVGEGAKADLRSYDPMFSPLLWTTVATGKAPTEHGIADFLVFSSAGGDRRPITSDFRRVKALWNIFSDFDRRSSWIGWWASYPAESIRGLIVTDYLGAALGRKAPDEAAALAGILSPAGALKDPARLLVTPLQITQPEVARIIPVSDDEYRAAREELARAPEKSDKDRSRTDSPVAFIMRVLSIARTFHDVALEEIKAGSPFVAVYYEGIDMMGHGFQHFLAPKMSIVSDDDFQRFKDAVPHYYEFQDELLGEVVCAAGPRAVTILLSDHGFRTGADRPNFAPSTKGQPEEWHRDWGILALRGPGIHHGELSPASIYDITPTLLYLEGLPLAGDMPGRLIVDAFEPAVLRERPPAEVKSYELVGARLEHAGDAEADPVAMHEMMANLRALGYVGGSEEGAHQETGAVAEGAPRTPETQYFFHRNLAVLYIKQGRLTDAEAELQAANDRKPQGKTYEMLSQVRASQGRYADAVAALEDGWGKVPDLMDPSSLLWIVELDLLSGNPAAAKGASEKWSPRMSPAVRAAVDGRLSDATGDVPGAMAAYRRALDGDPLLVRIAERLHEIDASQGQPLAIEPFLMQTLASNPKVDAYWDLAGQIALARGDAAEAVTRFRRANAQQPDDGLYLGHLASALAAAGSPQEARTTLAWADRFPPREADAWMALGSAWDRLGEPERALRAFSSAKAAGLRGPGADIGAALALARAGRKTEARSILAAAAEKFPQSRAVSDLRDRLGR